MGVGGLGRAPRGPQKVGSLGRDCSCLHSQTAVGEVALSASWHCEYSVSSTAAVGSVREASMSAVPGPLVLLAS